MLKVGIGGLQGLVFYDSVEGGVGIMGGYGVGIYANYSRCVSGGLY